MAVEMPVRVDAESGAAVVEFPWESASAVVDALDGARSTLSSSLASRAMMWSSIDDWEGSFRHDFDEAYLRLTAVAIDLVERAPWRAASVVDAADDANTAQRQANDDAEEASGPRGWLPL